MSSLQQTLFEPRILRSNFRLRLLYTVSDLVAKSWRLYPNFSADCGTDYDWLRHSELREILAPSVYNMPFNQTIQSTMVQSRNYGPGVSQNVP
jgi:hypothetical protein